ATLCERVYAPQADQSTLMTRFVNRDGSAHAGQVQLDLRLVAVAVDHVDLAVGARAGQREDRGHAQGGIAEAELVPVQLARGLGGQGGGRAAPRPPCE